MSQSLFVQPQESDWSIFWILTLFLNVFGLIWIAVWAFQPANNSITAIGIFVIMFAFTISGIVFSQFFGQDLTRYGNWFLESLFFTIGFFTWLLINSRGATKSVVNGVAQTAKTSVFSFVTFQTSPLTVVSSNMPLLLSFVFTVFLIPISEELAFLIAIPSLLFILFDQIAKTQAWLRNKIVQNVLAATISGVLFGLFHVGSSSSSFFIGAFMFRFITVMVVYTWTKYSHITKSIAVGAHIGNNWAAYGFLNGVSILTQNFFPVGMIIMGFLFVILFTTICVPIYRKFIQGA